jgi:protein SCO1
MHVKPNIWIHRLRLEIRGRNLSDFEGTRWHPIVRNHELSAVLLVDQEVPRQRDSTENNGEDSTPNCWQPRIISRHDQPIELSTSVMNKKIIPVISLVFLGIGFLASWLIHVNRPIVLESGVWFGEQARPLPNFSWTDQLGNTVDRNRLTGKWSLMFFGYTHCPDICPIGLQILVTMKQVIEKPATRDAINIYFVSVDPKRDTPEQLAHYLPYFSEDIIGATAPESALRPVTGMLGISHSIRNSNLANIDYEVAHSSTIVLINPDAEYAGIFSAPHDPKSIANDMITIIERN